MISDRKHIQNLISAISNDSLAVFVGAGISKTSETEAITLPIWKDLVIELKHDLGIQDENDYLKIAQLYYLEFGEYSYYKKLKDFFPDFVKPSAIHKLIFQINPNIIITTNWDDILERTIEENAFIFDIIRSDLDLAKSSLRNKLIKMHGDFTNHNIVFKEDDYIDYNHSFPLIENYVKSILSTHTVLFLGYSYNDFNLKQILKWIQNHSAVRPPMYLTVFSDKPTLKKYLENHDITTLLLTDKTEGIEFQNEYSNKTFTFLKKIKNKDEINVVKTKSQTIGFILNKLAIFDQLEGVLLKQIQKALSNCGFVFDDDAKPILEFYDKVISRDFDRVRRNIFQKFVEHLKEIEDGQKPDPKLKKIFEILAKADVKGIITSSDSLLSINKKYLIFEEYLEDRKYDSINSYLNFDFLNLARIDKDIKGLMDYAFKLHQIDRDEEAFLITEESISLCLKQKNYALLFISMFNRNALLWRLKFSISHEIDIEKYVDIEEYDLYEFFFNLPKNLQLAIEPIFKFVDTSLIVKYAFEVSEELKKTEDSKRVIESGGMVYNTEITKYSSNHDNIVKFVLRNKIMVENVPEFKSINRHFIKIAILRQIQKETVTLNQIELFSCIKYIDHKDLKLILDDFYNKKSEKHGKFQISEDCRLWLISNVFENVVDNFLSSTIRFNKFEGYIQKTLFILSLLKHSKEEFDNIIKIIIRLMTDGNNTLYPSDKPRIF